MTDHTVPTGDPWDTKELEIRQDFSLERRTVSNRNNHYRRIQHGRRYYQNRQTNTVISGLLNAKRNTYHSRGDFFWANQEANETPEEHRKKLITLEKNCEFKDKKQEDFLISKFITSITGKNSGRNSSVKKNNKFEDHRGTQYSKQLRPTTQTTPALAKDKEIKQEPIQKIQTKQNREQRKTPKSNDCGFCGQQNL